MTHPDFRAKLEHIANAKRFDPAYFKDDSEFAAWAQSRARAALAVPQQGAPSDEELHVCKNQAVGDYLRSLAGTNAAIFSAEQLMNAQAVGLRAVLARYGAQAVPVAVAVAERLPEVES